MWIVLLIAGVVGQAKGDQADAVGEKPAPKGKAAAKRPGKDLNPDLVAFLSKFEKGKQERIDALRKKGASQKAVEPRFG